MNSYQKNCNYCHEEFTTKDNRQLYCSKSHKTMASEVRNGKRQAMPMPIKPGTISKDQKREYEDSIRMSNEIISAKKKEWESILCELPYLRKFASRPKLKEAIELAQYAYQLNIDNKNSELSKEWKEKLEEALEYEKNWFSIKEKLELIEKRIGYFNGEIRKQERRIAEFQYLLKNSDTSIDFNNIEFQLFESPRYDFEFNESILGSFPEMNNPFVGLVFGEKRTGKSIIIQGLARLFSYQLLEETLVAIDPFQKNSALHTLEKMEMNKFSKIIFPKSWKEIESKLASNNLRFLLIDSNDFFKVNSNQISRVQKKFPFLSIILCSTNKAQLNKHAFELHIECVKGFNTHMNSFYGDAEILETDQGFHIWEKSLEGEITVLGF